MTESTPSKKDFWFVVSNDSIPPGTKPSAGPIVVASIGAEPLFAPMSEPFEIAGGTQTSVRNLLVRLDLSDGTTGFGECAPSPHDGPQALERIHASLREASSNLIGLSGERLGPFCQKTGDICGNGPARAALEMAFLDAWTRRHRLPLWIYFGGAEASLSTDVTVPILPPAEAGKAARKILKRGISTIKIKVGRDLEEDEARVRAVVGAAPKARLILDANQGYGPREALKLLKTLARTDIRPALFEQPVAKDDIDGLAKIEREGGVPVAADESASSVGDIWKLTRRKAASVVNIKLMKFGVWEAWQAARAARAAGMGLMMGGMVESRLAMGCAAHLAGGFGGFDFIDLDTPLWFAEDPMKGPLRIGPGGVYSLQAVRSGIGITPKKFRRA